MTHTEPVKRLVAGLAAVLLLVSGCGRVLDGAAEPVGRAAVSASFFAGDIATYGQTVSNSDRAALAYLRALRRVDVCALISPDALAKIGEIRSIGTLFELDECDAEIKMPDRPNFRLVTVELALTQTTAAPAFMAGNTAVYESAAGSCEYLIPLNLNRLPGAPRLRKPNQPYLRIGLIGEPDCGVTRKLVSAIAAAVPAAALPPRDAAAIYPVALADRDPCEVLGAVGADVDHWDIGRSTPYQCEFGIWRDGYPDVVSMRVALEPKIVDVVTEGADHRRTDAGADLYLDRTFCSAVVFVGPPMQRRLPGGDFVDVGDVVVRPAVSVDSGGGDCEPVLGVANAAAKVFG